MENNLISGAILEICRESARSLTAEREKATPHRHALQEVYESVLNSDAARYAAEQAERLFTGVTQLTRADEPQIRRFAHGWGNTHVSSDLVIGLAHRLHEAGADKAAGDMIKVVAEDIGMRGKPHREMFADFANALCARDSWRRDANNVSACREFRRYLSHARVREPDLAVGILTTAASEIWNVGEYTALAHHFPAWMRDVMGLSDVEAKKANAYIRVHAGQAELDHFHSAIDAWDKLAAHSGDEQKLTLAEQTMQRYLVELARAYKGLADSIRPQDDRRASAGDLLPA